MRFASIIALAVVVGPSVASGPIDGFVNWESPHVSPLDVTPDGTRLLAVNTADGRLEIFTIDGDDLVPAGSVAVGLDPVSVRARSSNEAWVINHISDTISIVDLSTRNVVATIVTGDEPADVVFTGSPPRAFVTLSQRNEVHVFDPANLSSPPIVIGIEGEDPRALATDGTRVFAAIFESGNGTTIISSAVVSSGLNPYPGNPNPPPNAGLGFDPPINAGLPAPPEAGVVVRKTPGGSWVDGNGSEWAQAITGDLHDHDVAVIDATTLAVSYVSGLMTTPMHLDVTPGGAVSVVGTEAFNEVRFEPNLNGVFLEVRGTLFTPPAAAASSIVDLNPHLDYTAPSVPQATRDLSLGDPRGIDWNASGSRGYVTGMGSNNLVVVTASLGRVFNVEIGAGPTGVRVNDALDVVYTLNRFDASVSVVSTVTLTEIRRVPLHDATPAAVRLGRPHLFDTHATSGLGHVSCASCHLDSRTDRLAWDLGDPSGAVKPFNQLCNFGQGGGCEDWHPMKGPLMTQTLQGIIGTEPLHWRGDREQLASFNPTFQNLLGDDEQLTPQEMQAFEDYLDTIVFPPNPYRRMDGTLDTAVVIPGSSPRVGNALNGRLLFLIAGLDVVNCSECHILDEGTSPQVTPSFLIDQAQSLNVPQLRDLYEKTGFESGGTGNRGFGFSHDGSVHTVLDFLLEPRFSFIDDQERIDVEAFVFSFASETHAGIGAQATLGGPGPDQSPRRDELKAIAAADDDVALIVQGRYAGETRGFRWDDAGGVYQSDRAAETVSAALLEPTPGLGDERTWTLVPEETATRLGLDRDLDGVFDRDELDICSNPADPAMTTGAVSMPCCDAICAADPLCCTLLWDDRCASLAGTVCAPCPGDTDGSGAVNVDDIVNVVLDFGTDGVAHGGDVDGSGVVTVDDIVLVVLNFGPCPPG